MSSKASCLLALLLGVSSTAALAQGRTPVWMPGTVIGVNGSYYVTRDIAGAGAAPVITIAAPNVDLDLNGHTVGSPVGGGPPVISIPAGFSEIRIHNGRLLGGSMSVDATAGRKLVIEKVHSQDAAGGPGALHTFDIEDVVIRECTVVGASAAAGITLDGAMPGKTGTIEGNVIESDAALGSAGIRIVAAQALALLHNRIDVAGVGIELDGNGCLISENTVRSLGADGIVLRQGKGNKFFDNVVQGCAGNGIILLPPSADSLVLNNVAASNGGHGLWVQGPRNLVERNTLNGNGGCGLFFLAPLNTFGRNMARGNGGAACGPCGGGLFPPDSCTAAPGNSSFGDNLIPGPPVF